MIKLPDATEYQMAIQNPHLVFSDPELKGSTVQTNPLGMPVVESGGFALTYHLHNGRRHWAVRCFWKDIPNLRLRYEGISRFIREKSSDGIFVEAQLIQDGIRVMNGWYPIIKMEWVEGDNLNLYIEKHLTDGHGLKKSCAKFCRLVEKLEQLGIGHGDLHPANIKVRNGDLTLIDYDGMYLPQLASLRPNQIGHFNFQHPQRSDCHYGPEIDRFSTLVIYTGMQSLIVRPGLWKKYGTSENLLFGSQDFLEPEKSNLFRELRGIAPIKPFADKLLDICKLPIENVPRLKDFLNPQFNLPTAPPAQIMTVTIQRQYPIIEAFDTETLLRHVGQKIEVVGYVTNLYSSIDKNQKRYAFLFLKSDKMPSLALTIWPRTLEYFEQQGIGPEIYVKKWVSVTGLITNYLNKPQIEITMPSEIQILADYKEASQRLGRPVPKIQNDFNSRGRKSKTIDVQTIRKLSQPYSKAKPSGILRWIKSILRPI